MAHIILAARKPLEVTELNTTINWVITSSYPPIAPLTENTGLVKYRIQQTSFQPTVQEDLGVNISPFATDRFVHSPKEDIPTAIENPVTGEQVDISIDRGVLPNEFICWDGWEQYEEGTLALSTTDLIRAVSLKGYQYVTGKLQNISSIEWSTDTGKVVVLNNNNQASEASSVFPVVLPALNVDSSDKVITIKGRDVSNTALWTLTYRIECGWEEVYTIGFINRFGVWEFFDGLGRAQLGVKTHNEKYVSYGNGLGQKYLANGNRTMLLNTGWVGENFDSVLEDLLMSEHVVLYTGKNSTSTRLIVQDTDKVFKDDRVDKVINYQITFETAGKVIPIV